MKLSWTQISATSLSKELEIKMNAQVEGSNGLPPTEQTELTTTEIHILGACRQSYLDQTAISITECLAIEEAKDSCLALMRRDGHNQLIADLKRGWTTKKNSFQGKAKRRKEAITEADTRLHAFRLENGIVASRQPKKRSSLKLIFSILLPFILGAVEIRINLGFLAESLGGNEALAMAAMVSIVNIGLSFLVARLCITHYMNPVTTSSHHALYLILILIFGAILIYVNSMIGVFRGLIEIANTTGNLELFQLALTNSVWPFDDFTSESGGGGLTVQSVFLMIVGYFFALTALLDGYYFDDPINGYGALGRAKYDPEKKLNKMIDVDLDKLITSSQNDSFDQLASKRDGRNEAVLEWGRISNQLQGNELRFNDNYNVNMEETIDSLINLYRTTNKKSRGDLPPPAYFNSPVDKEFIGNFTTIHANIANEVRDDPLRLEMEADYRLIITEEYNQSHKELTSYFNTEETDIRAYV